MLREAAKWEGSGFTFGELPEYTRCAHDLVWAEVGEDCSLDPVEGAASLCLSANLFVLNLSVMKETNK